MSIWKNVLVYADGRPEARMALAEGIRLAAHADGRATALDVLSQLPSRIPPGLLALAQDELLELIQEQRTEQLQEDVAGLQLLEPVTVRVTHGNPAFELIRHGVNGRHDLIVKAARGRDVRHLTSFGTTALHLIRKSPLPVLVVSPEQRLLERPKVLCAVDPSEDEAKIELNRRLLASARGLAEVYGADVHVVHVLDAQRIGAYRAFLGADAFAQFLQGWQRAVAKGLETLISQQLAGLPQAHAHLLEGDPSDVIVNLAEKEKVSHLVIGSVSHTEPGALIGSLAEDVLSRVDCSVLTMKPADFKTPVVVRGTETLVA